MQTCEPELEPKAFKEFQKLIYALAGINLSDAKLVMVQGRLAKRLRALNLESYDHYLQLLKSGDLPDEQTQFINCLTTNKTDFFRESHHFDFLKNIVFPRVEQRALRTGDRTIRIWSSASSTGEEPYSIAMCAAEHFARQSGWEIKILATDIDTNVLATASGAIYDRDRIDEIPASYRTRFLQKLPGDKYQVTSDLRDLIRFNQVNLLADQWPFRSQFDVIFCRNVMIYFDAPSQRKLIEHFASYLRNDGNLIIGHSESLFGISDRFKLLGDTIYRFADYQEADTAPARRIPTSVFVPAAKPTAKDASGEEHPRSAIQRSTNDAPKVPIIVGEVHASAEPTWITTTLGSCVSVCLYDESAKIGGMNHFMLPKSASDTRISCSFGVHAMELLINRIMRLGGDRSQLKAKLFGGSAVLDNISGDIGQKNVSFARDFLDKEGIPLVGSHTGGRLGMQVFFNPCTSKVFCENLTAQLPALSRTKTKPSPSVRLKLKGERWISPFFKSCRNQKYVCW